MNSHNTTIKFSPCRGETQAPEFEDPPNSHTLTGCRKTFAVRPASAFLGRYFRGTAQPTIGQKTELLPT